MEVILFGNYIKKTQKIWGLGAYKPFIVSRVGDVGWVFDGSVST